MLYRFFAPKKFFETKRSLYKSLIYNLEFVYKEFGSLRGVSSYKFDLHFSEKNNSWITSSKEKVSEEKAIEITTIIRDSLVKWFDLIENTSFRTIEDYENFKNLKNYNFSLLEKWWVLKYLHILYPEKFSCFYTKSNLDKILDKMEIKKGENNFIKNGQLALIANELEIHNVFLNDILLKLNLFTETKKKKKVKLNLKMK